VIRWRDDNGAWSKEHEVDLGASGQTNWPNMIPTRGMYVTRQWEIIMTDRGQLVVSAIEEEVEGLDE
jgi:hypothetical protein